MNCLRVLLTLGISGWLIACGSQHHTNAKTQVVAKVNDREITTMQLNQTLASLNPPALTPEVTQHALSSLVDEEILVQEAQKAQLDREPATVAALEHARRRILAQTFAERQIFPRTQVSLTEQEKYYEAHPALFEDRKIYRLTAYTIHSPDMTDLLENDLNATKSADQVRDVLNKHGIRYEVQMVNAPAEDLPLEKIDQFASAKVGDLLTANQPGNKVLLISVVSLEDKPLTFERAKPVITAYLTKERNARAIEDHLKMQRNGARVSYLGEFSKYSTARVE